MKVLGKRISKRFKIAAATASAIFSLATVFTATIAWFAASNSVEATGMQIMVKAEGGLDIESIRLIKFDYATIQLSENVVIEDYLNPDRGAVNSYDYNESENSFGKFVEVDANTGNYSYVNGEYVKGAANSGSYIWQTVDAMNIYDPFEKIIKGSSFELSSMHSNAIYEITFSAPSQDYILNATSQIINSRSKESDQIYLSKCTDFDAFYVEDLSTTVSSYSDSATYSVNDLIIHNGLIYQCNTAINSGESFTAGHWTAVNEYSNVSTYAVGQAVIESGVIYVCRTAIGTPEIFTASKWNKATTYSNSSTYSLDDVVFYNGACYQANTDIDSAEAFASTHWKPILFNNTYIPSYKPSLTTDDEALYYKMSFLSSKKESHKHFYVANGAEPTSVNLNDVDEYIIHQSNNQFKAYINVNYAPSQLERYYSQIKSPADVIEAVYDFIFYFTFLDIGA